MTKEQLIDAAIKQASVNVSVSDVLEGVRMGIRAGVGFAYDQIMSEVGPKLTNFEARIKDLEQAAGEHVSEAN